MPEDGRDILIEALLSVLKVLIEDEGDGFGRPSPEYFAAVARGRAIIAEIQKGYEYAEC